MSIYRDGCVDAAWREWWAMVFNRSPAAMEIAGHLQAQDVNVNLPARDAENAAAEDTDASVDDGQQAPHDAC